MIVVSKIVIKKIAWIAIFPRTNLLSSTLSVEGSASRGKAAALMLRAPMAELRGREKYPYVFFRADAPGKWDTRSS